MPGWPIRKVVSGGIRVTEAASGKGMPYVESPNGVAVTFTASGGIPLSQGGGVARPLRAIATRGETNTTQGNVTSSTNMRLCRSRRYFGDVDATEMYLVYAGYVVPLSSGEINIGNDTPFQCYVEYNGVAVQVTFGGSGNGLIPNGAAEYISDKITPAMFGLSVFAAGAEFYIRNEATLATNAKYANVSQGGAASADTSLVAPTGSASQVNGVGAPVTGGGWASSGQATWMPCAIIGRTTGAAVSIMLVGDSIGWGSNDSYSDGNANGSFTKRAINATAQRKIAHTITATPGTTAKQFFTTGVSKRGSLFKYHTHVLCEYVTNDWSTNIGLALSDAANLADCQVSMQAIWASAKAAGCKVWQTKMFPRVNGNGGGSTDSFATDANQTPAGGCETGGTFRDPYHTWLASRVGIDIDGRLDGPVDANQSATFQDRWKTNGTALRQTNDGLHPSSVGHGDATASTRTWAYALTGS